MKFAPDTISSLKSVQQSNKLQQQQPQPPNALQRSKSLSSADALARGVAGMGLADGGNGGGAGNDIGAFKPEIQANIDQALKDPNQLNSRCLMDLANQIMERAVEGRRYVCARRFCQTFSPCKCSVSLFCFQLRSADISFLHCGSGERAQGNVLGSAVEHMPPVVSRARQGAGPTADHQEHCTASIHRLHGISNGNVLSIEAASIAIAHEMRWCAATIAAAYTAVQML